MKEHAKITIEIKMTEFGSEMKILNVEPQVNKLSRKFKEKIYDDWGIEIQ